MRQRFAFLVFGMVFLLTACGGPKAFTKGEYDDPTRVELLDDPGKVHQAAGEAIDLVDDHDIDQTLLNVH